MVATKPRPVANASDNFAFVHNEESAFGKESFALPGLGYVFGPTANLWRSHNRENLSASHPRMNSRPFRGGCRRACEVGQSNKADHSDESSKDDGNFTTHGILLSTDICAPNTSSILSNRQIGRKVATCRCKARKTNPVRGEIFIVRRRPRGHASFYFPATRGAPLENEKGHLQVQPSINMAPLTGFNPKQCALSRIATRYQFA